MFKDIDENNDKELTVRELERWRYKQSKERAKRRLRRQSGVSDRLFVYCYEEEVKVDEDEKVVYRYEFSRQQKQRKHLVTDELDLNASDDEVKWAVFRRGLPLDLEQKFKRRPKKARPKGYWMILSDDEEKNKETVDDVLDIASLRKIHRLLHYFYIMKLNRGDGDRRQQNALYKLICDGEGSGLKWGRDETNFEVRFVIGDSEYRLTWWNEKGKHDPNAFSIIKTSGGDAGGAEISNREVHYIRFSLPDKLQWQWYYMNSVFFDVISLFRC